MRTWTLAIAAVVIGGGLGAGLSFYELATAGDYFDTRNVAAASVEAMPRVSVIGQSEHDFGTLERNRSGETVFRVRNDGNAVLSLSLDGFSCGMCVQSDFQTASLEPKETVDVKVTYKTQKPGPKFAEYLDLRTTDPAQPMIRLNIFGYVVSPVRLSVEQGLALGSISSTEPSVADFNVYGFQDEPLEVIEHSFDNPETAEFFEVETEPLSQDEVATEQHARSGARVKVRVKPGLPLGPFTQTLRITSKMGDKEVPSELVVRGNVSGDIMILGGSNFSRDSNLLRVGVVPHETGATAELRIRVKGPYREQTKFEIVEVDPADALEARLGEPSILGDGSVYLFPLSISIRKEASAVNRLGTSQGKVGVVKLHTTHPEASELPIYVSFAIE